MTKPDDFSAFREKQFANAVNQLEELLAQSGRAFLIGAGCSKCAGLPLTAELTKKVLGSSALNQASKEILGGIQQFFDGSTNANIEDYLSELIDLLAIADRRVSRGVAHSDLQVGESSYDLAALRDATDHIKNGVAEAVRAKVTMDTHRSFVRAVHRPLRPGRPTSGQSVDYLVLNYDTVLEDALALERIPFSDGLSGGATGWWDPRMFDSDGLAARVYKMHGSIDWCEFPDDLLPRRLGVGVQSEQADERRILIWPASTKYRETQLDPFAQLLERSRRILRPRSGSQRVLVICGYSFGDAHINSEVDQALRETRDLTVVAFTEANEPQDQLKIWHEDDSTSEQVLIFANRGFFHGSTKESSDNDLLWWKFENLTRILGGEK